MVFAAPPDPAVVDGLWDASEEKPDALASSLDDGKCAATGKMPKMVSAECSPPCPVLW